MLEYLLGVGVFVAVLMMGGKVLSQVWRTYLSSVSDGRPFLADIASSACLGLGIVLLIIPAVFWWWFRGSRERFLWIISGPAPFDRLGSGPVQVWIGLLSIGMGVGLFALGVALRRTSKGQ